MLNVYVFSLTVRGTENLVMNKTEALPHDCSIQGFISVTVSTVLSSLSKG